MENIILKNASDLKENMVIQYKDKKAAIIEIHKYGNNGDHFVFTLKNNKATGYELCLHKSEHAIVYSNLTPDDVLKAEKYAFICSPFSGDTERNIAYAIECCKEAVKRGYTPIAPHLYFPQFLDDNDPEQRKMGLTLGREAMKEKCEIVLVGDKYGISEGMKGDLEFAEKIDVPVEYLNTLNGFNKSEVIMAIRLVLGIVNAQGYKLDVYEDSEPGTEILRFTLLDKKGCCLYECDALYEVITYIQNIAKNKINFIFLSYLNDPAIDKILSTITAPIYTDYVATGFGNNKNVIEEEIEV